MIQRKYIQITAGRQKKSIYKSLKGKVYTNNCRTPKNEYMNAKEFFYLVAEMRSAQQAYFETKDRKVFRAARALENEVDREIRRVREIVNREP